MPGPMQMQENPDWKSAAIEFWMNRARKRPPKNALSMSALIGEVKHWKQDKFAPGVLANDYIKVVSDALKSSSQFSYDPQEGTFVPVVSMSAGTPRANLPPMPGASMNFPANFADRAPALPPDDEFVHWFCKIKDITLRGSEPLSLVALKEGVAQRSPPGGYKGSDGKVINTEVFYQNLLKNLKAHPSLACTQEFGKRAMKWAGSGKDWDDSAMLDPSHATIGDSSSNHPSAQRDQGVQSRGPHQV